MKQGPQNLKYLKLKLIQFLSSVSPKSHFGVLPLPFPLNPRLIIWIANLCRRDFLLQQVSAVPSITELLS